MINLLTEVFVYKRLPAVGQDGGVCNRFPTPACILYHIQVLCGVSGHSGSCTPTSETVGSFRIITC